MRGRISISAVLLLLLTVSLTGCSETVGNQDLYIFEEFEAASAVDDPGKRIERLEIFAGNHYDHPARVFAYVKIMETMAVDQNDVDGAIAYHARLLEKETDQRVRGELLYREFAFLWDSDREKALEMAEEILGGSENDYKLHLYVSYYLIYEEGVADLAGKMLYKTQGLAVNDHQANHARSVLGEYFWKQGKKEEAYAAVIKAGKYPFAREIAGNYLWEQGKREESLDAYIDYAAGAPGGRHHANLDSLYALVYPGSEDLDAKIFSRMTIDEGPVEDMDFSDLNGRTHSISGYRGTKLVISAWSPT